MRRWIFPNVRLYSFCQSKMARSRRRYNIYSQPGLFDILNNRIDANPDESGLFEAHKGGDIVEDQETDAVIPALHENSSQRLKFISLGSGSSGNCAYLGTSNWGILIDGGVDVEKVEESLARHGIEMGHVIGVILTHDHSDHANYVYSIMRNFRHMAVFCTPRTLNGLLRRHGMSGRLKDYHHPIYKEIPFNIKDFKLTAFEVSHDGTDNVGYMIEWGKHRFVIATDMGFIGERAQFYMRQATSLMIESDYDEQMLIKGHYPQYLKSRIMAQRGHLSNLQVSDFLSKHWTPLLTHVFLCHLSKDNNTPAIALEAAREALGRAGAERVGDCSEDLFNREAPVQLYALPRFDASPLFYIR